MFYLTEEGKYEVQCFIRECVAKRKEVLDAGIDTADETELPTEEDIVSDIKWFEDGEEYINSWGVTDNTDLPLCLERNKHYYEEVA